MRPLLEVKDLTAGFRQGDRETIALKGISFTVSRGEIVGLVGESGSGKSVTSLSILRLLPEPPAFYPAGSILFSEDGVNAMDLLHLDRTQLQQLRGNSIAMIFQEPMTSLNPVYTCGNQVMEALRSHQPYTDSAAREKTIEWFRKVLLPEPEKMFDRYPHQLSGGQKQRVMIAMAMCCEPSLLICDEPTTALDVTVQRSILQLIRALQQEAGMAVIFITHDLGVVGEIADRTVVMYKGEVVEQQTTEHVFTSPTHAYTRGLLACRPVLHRKGYRLPVVSDFLSGTEYVPVLSGTANTSDMQTIPVNSDGTATSNGLSKTAVPARRIGSVISNEPAKMAMPAKKDVLVKVEQLSVRYPGKRNFLGRPLSWIPAVDNVSFEIYRNETLGLVGESGCGKTTLGRALLRLIEPSSGSVTYDDIPFGQMNRQHLQALRRRMQIIFQDPYSSLNPRVSVGNAIAEPIRVHGLLKGKTAIRERVSGLLQKVGLNASMYNRYPHEFSGGQRQRIVIARALALRPEFIVCDESVSALDVSVQAQVLNLLNDLRAEFGFTVVFISHDLSVIRYISDRILVMQKGRIVESGPAEDLYNHPQTAYTSQLIASIPKGILPAGS